ncbi:MAG TPA: hypothetical protein VGB47_09740 [Thermoanaerobaculia bacterium]
MRRRMGAAGCFGRGLRLSLSKPYLAVSLWLIQLLLASVLVLPVSNALHSLLDFSSSGSRMIADPDFGWWETVRRTHPDLLGTLPDIVESAAGAEGAKSSSLADLQGIGATAISLAMLGIVLHAFALGGVFGALREPQASLVVFGREGMRRFPAFLAFTLAALAAALAAYRWIYLETGEAWRDRMNELDTEGQAMALTAVRLLVFLVVLAIIKLIADSVRAIWVARPDLPAVSRLFAGIAAALSRPARLFGVLLLYGICGGALYALWIVLDPSAGGEARFALVPLILTQQVFVFLRSLLKVGYYAGVSEALTREPSPEYSYVPAPAAGVPLSVPPGPDEAPVEGPPGAI